MGNLQGFDATQVDPSEEFVPLPAGWYRAMIIGSEFRPTKSGDGEYLMLTISIIDGDYAGRQVFDRLNLSNPNPKAEEIAQRNLSAICHAVGIMTPKDSAELHDIPFDVKLTTRPAQGQYSAGNDIKGYRSIDGQEGKNKQQTEKIAPWKR